MSARESSVRRPKDHVFLQQDQLSKPSAAGAKQKLMKQESKAAARDLVEKVIRSRLKCSLFPTAAMFCSIIPGHPEVRVCRLHCPTVFQALSVRREPEFKRRKTYRKKTQRLC